MKSSLLIVFCFIILVFLNFGFSQTVHVDSAMSSVKEEVNEDGNISRTTINSRYDFVERYKKTTLLLKQVTRITKTTGSEGSSSSTIVEAFSAPFYNVLNWRIHDPGEKSRLHSDFFETVKNGCCGSTNTRFLYSLNTGKIVAQYDANLLKIKSEGKDVKQRIVSYLSVNASVTPTDMALSKNICGILTYANEDSILSTYIFLSEGEDTEWYIFPPELSLILPNGYTYNNELRLDHSYAKTEEKFRFDNIKIKMDYGKDSEHFVEIPIKKDILLITSTVKPNGIWIEDLAKVRYLFSQRFRDISKAAGKELRILRNEIFARHGQAFESQDLRDYFNKQRWYHEKPGYKVSADELSHQEQILLNQIIKLESK